jgi:hypothetical protein
MNPDATSTTAQASPQAEIHIDMGDVLRDGKYTVKQGPSRLKNIPSVKPRKSDGPEGDVQKNVPKAS